MAAFIMPLLIVFIRAVLLLGRANCKDSLQAK